MSKQDETAIRMLWAMAVADGELHEREKEFLVRVAINRGVDSYEFKRIISTDPDSLDFPTDSAGKHRLVRECMAMMMADLEIDDEEYRFLEKIAQAMEMPFEEFKAIVNGE